MEDINVYLSSTVPNASKFSLFLFFPLFLSFCFSTLCLFYSLCLCYCLSIDLSLFIYSPISPSLSLSFYLSIYLCIHLGSWKLNQRILDICDLWNIYFLWEYLIIAVIDSGRTELCSTFASNELDHLYRLISRLCNLAGEKVLDCICIM